MADPGCLSWIPDHDFYPSRMPDPGSRIPDPGSRISDPGSRIQKQQQKRGVKKNISHNFLCSHKFHKIVNYFSFKVPQKKTWANFQRIKELFTQKIVTKLSKIWVWDPWSKIRDPGVKKAPDPGVKKSPDPGSRTRIRNTAKYLKSWHICHSCEKKYF